MNNISLKTFLRKYPNSDACLEEIFNKRYPNGVECIKCKKITKYYKIEGRTAYSCEYCRTQIYPLAGTIFEKSSIDLRLWFYAMFLMIKTRSGISAKQLERELGVCYKTALRMFRQIRTLMQENNGNMLTGEVEVDETFIGGKGINRRYVWYGGEKEKQIVMGMIQRNGKAYLKHVPDTSKWTLINQIKENVDAKARVITDEYKSYAELNRYGYDHEFINHQIGYVENNIHTNTAENCWSNLKRSIYGVYRHISKKYLQSYVDEFTWRYNHRLEPNMFEQLLNQVALVKVLKTGQLV